MNARVLQLKYFASVDHATRFSWQTEDAFVIEHEHAALKPLVDAIQARFSGQTIRILESGCGEGVNLVHLRQLGLTPERVRMEGIDMSEVAVAEAEKRGLPVKIGDGLQLDYQAAEFEVVFCRDVLHHLANDEERVRFFNEMKRVVKPGGIVAAIEPNPRNPGIRALATFVQAERGLLQMNEEHVRELIPGASVYRVAPSSVWRVFYHYRSPLRRLPVLAALTRYVCRAWDKACAKGPGGMWSYRVYLWDIE